MLYEILLGFFLVVALALIVTILLQQGKGAVMGASFGAGASGSVFGSSGASNFLTRLTTILAILFFSSALAIGYLVSNKTVDSSDSVFDAPLVEADTMPEAPASSEQNLMPAAPKDEENSVEPTLPSAPVSEANETLSQEATSQKDIPAETSSDNAEEISQQENKPETVE